MKLSVRRAAALVAVPVVASAALVAAPATAAQAAPTTPATPEATAAANWLATQMDDGTLSNVGQVIDFGVGLVATGAAPQVLDALMTELDAEVSDWANGSTTRTAKAAWFYALAGDPQAELLASVEDSTDDDTGALGGSFPQQWFGTLALVEGGSAEAAASVDHLRSGQCADGGWGYSIPCSGEGDQFATFYSLAALASVEDPDASLRTDIAEAVAFLEDKQSATGGFETCTEYAEDWSCLKTEEDANDTGLGAWSLGLAGASASAAEAATWLAAHQFVSLPACGLTPADAGAISWTDTTYAEGVTDQNRAQTAFASAQALGGLAYLPASRAAVSVRVRSRYVAAGTTVPVKVAGLRRGEIACLTGVGGATLVDGVNGAVDVTLPAATRNHEVTLTTLGTTDSTTVKALGRARFTLKLDKKIEKGDKQAVKITGLAPREKVVVRVDGKKVDKGTATAKGGFKAVFKAAGKAGRIGKRKLTVDGQFANRSGKATYKVVR